MEENIFVKPQEKVKKEGNLEVYKIYTRWFKLSIQIVLQQILVVAIFIFFLIAC